MITDESLLAPMVIMDLRNKCGDDNRGGEDRFQAPFATTGRAAALPALVAADFEDFSFAPRGLIDNAITWSEKKWQ